MGEKMNNFTRFSGFWFLLWMVQTVNFWSQYFMKGDLSSNKWKDTKNRIDQMKEKLDNAYADPKTFVITPEDIAKMQKDITDIYNAINKTDKEQAKVDSLNLELAKAKKMQDMGK